MDIKLKKLTKQDKLKLQQLMDDVVSGKVIIPKIDSKMISYPDMPIANNCRRCPDCPNNRY